MTAEEELDDEWVFENVLKDIIEDAMQTDKERVDTCWKEKETGEIRFKYQHEYKKIEKDRECDFLGMKPNFKKEVDDKIRDKDPLLKKKFWVIEHVRVMKQQIKTVMRREIDHYKKTLND
jgi:hypothetical protein